MTEIGEQKVKLSNGQKPLTNNDTTTKISYEDFLDWADEDTLAEWVDGKIVMTSPASYKHQRLSKFLIKLLDDFAEAFDLGEVIPPPFQMKIPQSGREPDLIFVAKERLNRIQNSFVDGPADMVIEIISPESIERDRKDKFEEYAAGGVPEFWLIDPGQQQAEFYQLDQNQQYQRIMPDADGKYYSRSVKNFWLKEEWLWQAPLPRVQKLLKLIGGTAYQDYLNS